MSTTSVSRNPGKAPRWMSIVLMVAAVYNLAFGLWAVFFPMAAFHLAGFEELPRYPALWQCIGMIVGVYGVGYGIAATNPTRHWPIVLVGLLGKIFGPVGFVWTLVTGEFPLELGLILLTNDLIWWIPFGMILWRAVVANQPAPKLPAEGAANTETVTDQFGRTMDQLSQEGPVLVVLLRHCGCTFTRQALADLRDCRSELEDRGVTLALVSQRDPDEFTDFVKVYNLDDVPRFSDPELRAYRRFGLQLGRFDQLFGPRTFWQGFKAVILQGHGVGGLKGNGLQLPGVALLSEGRTVHVHRHQHAGERPDYVEIASRIDPADRSRSPVASGAVR